MIFEEKDWYPHLLQSPPVKWNHSRTQLNLIFSRGFKFSMDFSNNDTHLFHKDKFLYSFSHEETELMLVNMVNQWGDSFGKKLREQVQQAQKNMLPEKLAKAFESYHVKDLRFDKKENKIIYFFSDKIRFIVENNYQPPRGVLVEGGKIRLKVPAKFLQRVAIQLFTQTIQNGQSGEWDRILLKFSRILKKDAFASPENRESKPKRAKNTPDKKTKPIRSLRSK